MDKKRVYSKKGRAVGQSGKTHRQKQKVLGESELKQPIQSTRDDRFYEDIVETIREPLLVLDSNLRVICANQRFYETFKVTARETIGNPIYDLGNRQWDIPGLHTLLEEILPKQTRFNDFQIEHDFPAIGRRSMLVNARQIADQTEKRELILLAVEDVTDHTRIEQALQKSEERFRRSFETAKDGMLLIDKISGQISNSNQAAQDLLGYSEKAMLKNKIWKIGIIKDGREFKKAAVQLEEKGFINLYNTSVKTRDGREIAADVYLMDKVKMFLCNIRGITGRKIISDELFENENRYRELFNNINSGVAVYEAVENGRDFIFKDFNAAAEKIDRIPHEKIIGRKVTEVFPGIREMTLLETFQRVWKTGKPEHHPATIYEDNRLVGWRENYVYKLLSGEIVAVYEDITERMQARQALAESEEKFRWLYEHAPVAYQILTPDGIITSVNNRWCEVFGYIREEVLGKEIFDFMVEKERITAKASFKRKQTEKVTFLEASDRNYQTKSGVVRTLKAHDFFVIDQDGNITAVQTALVDITERKLMEIESQFIGTHDNLTKLYNRAFFEEELSRLEKSRLFPVSIIMIDVDELKIINDTQGHAVGDKMLQRMAKVLKESFRAEDVVARIGGDEFVVVLPMTGENAANLAQKRINHFLEVSLEFN